MKMMSIERRLDALESELGQFCPRCTASQALSEEELDARIRALLSGQDAPELPEPSTSCPRCRKAAAMSEEELDESLARLLEIAERAVI